MQAALGRAMEGTPVAERAAAINSLLLRRRLQIYRVRSFPSLHPRCRGGWPSPHELSGAGGRRPPLRFSFTKRFLAAAPARSGASVFAQGNERISPAHVFPLISACRRFGCV